MKDQLKDFINQHRGDFDDKTPSEKTWKAIDGSLITSSKKTLWNSITLWRAAAVIFMALSAFLLLSRPETKQQQVATAVAMNEFNDVEAFYVEQISQKVELIDKFTRNEGLNGFTQDFKQLEAMYAVLKEEIKTHPSQKVKDALVLNLLVRIDLLNQQLHKLENDYGDEVKKRGEKKT
jgi:hypothetical protein